MIVMIGAALPGVDDRRGPWDQVHARGAVGEMDEAVPVLHTEDVTSACSSPDVEATPPPQPSTSARSVLAGMVWRRSRWVRRTQ